MVNLIMITVTPSKLNQHKVMVLCMIQCEPEN